MAFSERQKAFGLGKRDTLPAACKRCPYLKLCYGECPKNRIVRGEEGELGLNYLCPGIKAFFNYVHPILLGIASLLQPQHEEDQFRFRPGPVFGNLILADEINRASARVQSALLEAMEERHVTVAGKSWPLAGVFMVLATQNPVDQEGTWPLPEAQLDRFLMKVLVNYPSNEDEQRVMQLVRSEQQQKYHATKPATETPQNAPEVMLSQAEIADCWRAISDIYVAPAVENYIVNLVEMTRQPARHAGAE